MFVEPLETRSYLSAALDITVDTSHLASSVIAGKAVHGRLRIVVTNDGDAPVPGNLRFLNVQVKIVGDVPPDNTAPQLVYNPPRRVNVAHLAPGKSRSFTFHPRVPDSAPIETFRWIADATNGSVFSDANITVSGSELAGLQPNPLVVLAKPLPTDPITVSAITTPDSSGNAMVTLHNPTHHAVKGPVTFQIFAAVPGLRGYRAGDQVGGASAAFLAGRFTQTLRSLRGGRDVQVPVQLNLEFNPLPFAYTYELFGERTATLDFDPSTSTAPTLTQITIPASPNAPTASTLDNSPDPQIATPIQIAGGGSQRPTSIEQVDYTFFVDPNNVEGLIIATTIFSQGTTISAMISTAKA